jgi:hypothetical protein
MSNASSFQLARVSIIVFGFSLIVGLCFAEYSKSRSIAPDYWSDFAWGAGVLIVVYLVVIVVSLITALFKRTTKQKR